MVDQLKQEVIPLMEKISGNRFDEGKLKEYMARSAQAEDDFVFALESAKNVPSPVDGLFAGGYIIGPIFSAFRGTQDCIEYYGALRKEIEERIVRKEGPTTPDGMLAHEKYRLVVDGPPNWTSFREFWKMFYEEGAVPVVSTYTRVGGVYDQGFRHDPEEPLESLAHYCLGVYTNLSLPSRIDLLEKYIREYRADGFIMHSIKSCNSFSAGQLLMLRELERRTGLAGGFIESDLVDSRYYSPANIKNRLESYLQMIDQKRKRGDD
jgi:benzoyl-CoA reductase subunit B